MKVDELASRYQEDPAARREFSRKEARHAKYLLRRLRFLETQVAERGGTISRDDGNGGGVHAEIEMEALEWVLGPDGVGFILEPDE